MEQFFPKDRPVNINQAHNQAVDLMFEADAADRDNDKQLACDLRLKAAGLEEESLWQIPLGNIRTRAIIGDSAVSLYFKGGNFPKAKELGEKLLSDPTLIGQDYNLNDIRQVISEIEKSDRTPPQV